MAALAPPPPLPSHPPPSAPPQKKTSRTGQEVDLACANWLGDAEVPFSLVFTKTDAAKRGAPPPAANIGAFKAALAAEWEALPPCFETSAVTGAGRTPLLQHLAGLRQLHEAEED